MNTLFKIIIAFTMITVIIHFDITLIEMGWEAHLTAIDHYQYYGHINPKVLNDATTALVLYALTLLVTIGIGSLTYFFWTFKPNSDNDSEYR